MAQPTKRSTDRFDPLAKPEFGRAPDYLSTVKRQLAEEKEHVRQVVEAERAARHPQTQLRPMPEEERLALLAELKNRWEEVNRNFQQMAHLVKLDTNGKLRRKEQCEREMDELERAIEKLRKPNVLIAE